MAESTTLINEQPIIIDLYNKLALRDKFGFTAQEVDSMPIDKVDTYLFILDTIEKKKQLAVIR